MNNISLEDFVKISLSSNTLDKKFIINIADSTCQKIKDKVKLNIFTYKFIIKEESIRHINRGHKKDIKYIKDLPYIINNFDSVEKSITRNKVTGQNDISLVFKKVLDNNDIKTVALRIFNKKILSLKTLYRA